MIINLVTPQYVLRILQCAALGTLSLLLASPVQAQQNPPGAAAAGQICSTLGGQLLQDANDESVLDAFSQLQTCPDAGPRFIAERWRIATTDADLLWKWVRSTATILDERIFGTMLGVVLDRSQPRNVRLAALSVAVFQAEPVYLLRFDDQLSESPLPIDAAGPIRFLGYSPSISSHASLTKGTQPILGDGTQRLITALRDVMENASEDEHLRGAARSLLHSHFRVHVRSDSQPIDTAFVRGIRLSETTMSEVEARLGPPRAVTQRTDSVTWFYSYWERNRPAEGIAGQPSAISQVVSITFVGGTVVRVSNQRPGG